MKMTIALGLLFLSNGGLSSSVAWAQTCPPPLDARNRIPGDTTADALLGAIMSLQNHIKLTGPTLNDTEISAAASAISENAAQLTSDLHVMAGALDLIDDYEASDYGPMFINTERFPKGEFSRIPLNNDGYEIDRAIMILQQSILDEVYHASLWGPHEQGSDPVDWPYSPILRECQNVLRGRKWLISRWLAGVVDPPEDPTAIHNIQVNASYPTIWGRPISLSSPEIGLSRRIRPLGGLYLSPGEIATVTVPPELVNAGYTIQVGSQAVNNNRKDAYYRIDRMTTSFPIDGVDTPVANPLGGELFLRSPYGSEAGVITVSVTGGVVQSASFFMTSLKTTTQEEWDYLRTNATAPWVSLETDNYLSNVPTLWIYGFDYQHMHTLMSNYTNIMNAVTEIVGIPPEKRNNYVLYESLNRLTRAKAYGIGYPQTNNMVVGTANGPKLGGFHGEPGKANQWMVRDPMSTRHSTVSFHELGHTQRYRHSVYPGEKESIVHVPFTYARNVVYGDTIDESYKLSISYQNPITHIPSLTIDKAAIDWMVRDNFRMKNPMDTKFETPYQHIGHGKYADIARLFGWDVIKDFFYQEQMDYIELGDHPNYATELASSDSRTLRLSIAAGQDLTPLIHFWGIHPVDGVALKQKMIENNLYPSWATKKQLLHYATIVPQSRAEFYEHWQSVWKPEEVKKCHGQCKWYQETEPFWGEAQAAESVDAVLYIIAKYWPADTCIEPVPESTRRRMGVRGVSKAAEIRQESESFERKLSRAWQDLAAARKKWASQGAQSYSFELEHEVFEWPEEETGPFLVEVHSGKVTGAIYKDSGEAVDLEIAERVTTVDKLFDYIGETLNESVYENVIYDPVVGYPKEIYVISAEKNEEGDEEMEFVDTYVSNVSITEVSGSNSQCLDQGSDCTASSECCSNVCDGAGKCVDS